MAFLSKLSELLRGASRRRKLAAGPQATDGRRDFIKNSAGMAALWFAPASNVLLKAADHSNQGVAAAPTEASRAPNWIPSEPANEPMGVARGIFPGRVAWVRDSAATPWTGAKTETTNWWHDGEGVDQASVDSMTSRCLKSLTGAKSDRDAWEKIFHYFNRTHGRGDVGHSRQELVALKINCNNCYAGYADVDDQVDASPQAIRAMLRQLVHHAGVPQNRIVVYEAIRVIPDRIYDPCHAEFPEVLWMDSRGDGKNGRQPVDWHKGTFQYSVSEKNSCGNWIPELAYQATYMINMALLKGHPTCGFTLTAKNHYGSINERDHDIYINTHAHQMGIYNPFVDLIATRHLGGKTILFMVDGLFGTRDANDPIIREFASWTNLFSGQWSSSFLMSFDPVAIDSVGLDFLRSEFGGYLASSHGRGHDMHADNYLHEAALANHPPSGTVYRPDGAPIGSLGVHEHWNNAREKQYSRNLSLKGKGIELITVHS